MIMFPVEHPEIKMFRVIFIKPHFSRLLKAHVSPRQSAIFYFYFSNEKAPSSKEINSLDYQYKAPVRIPLHRE